MLLLQKLFVPLIVRVQPDKDLERRCRLADKILDQQRRIRRTIRSNAVRDHRILICAWAQSVPPRGSGWVRRSLLLSSASTTYPPATAGGTDCAQVRRSSS